MTTVDHPPAVLWTWDEPVPLVPHTTSPTYSFGGYRLPLAVGLGAVLVGLLTLAVLVVLGVL